MDDLALAKPRLALLLEHFSELQDARQSWRVAYPLREVLFLVVCATIANCDDYEDIADWGEAHLDFLRRFSDFHHGVPCADWLRALMNRVDPELFQACFRAWVAECFPGQLGLVAIDGKTSRRSHDRAAGKAPLHLVSAFATDTKLVLGQEVVAEKVNEIVAIPKLLERLDLDGALVSIDASKRSLASPRRLQSDHRPGDPRRRCRLSLGREGQSADLARRGGGLFRHRSGCGGRGRRGPR